MEASHSRPGLLCGARARARRPRSAATLHVRAGVLGRSASPALRGQSGVQVPYRQTSFMGAAGTLKSPGKDYPPGGGC